MTRSMSRVADFVVLKISRSSTSNRDHIRVFASQREEYKTEVSDFRNGRASIQGERPAFLIFFRLMYSNSKEGRKEGTNERGGN